MMARLRGHLSWVAALLRLPGRPQQAVRRVVLAGLSVPLTCWLGAGHVSANTVGMVAPRARALARVSTLLLGAQYSVLTSTPGGLVLTGPKAATAYPGTGTRCGSVVVDTATLTISSPRHASCADPRLWGERVLPVFKVEQHVFWGHGSQGINTGTVRIATQTASAPGYRLGPVVMTYQNASGRPQWLYGDGYLWIFSGTSGPRSEVLRVDEHTGAVLQRVFMASIVRPVLAVNDDGLWVVPAVNSFFADASDAVYHLAVGAPAAAAVHHLDPRANGVTVNWMVAVGHAVFIDLRKNNSPGTVLWRLDGPDGSLAYQRSASPLLNQISVEGGPPIAIADASGRVWAVTPNPLGSAFRALRVNPESGQASLVASVPTNDTFDDWQGASINGSLWLLVPSTSKLVRITPVNAEATNPTFTQRCQLNPPITNYRLARPALSIARLVPI